MHERPNRRRTLAKFVAGSAALLFCLVFTAIPGHGQSLAGRWVAPGRTLDNGEQEKSILELKQSGNELTGTLKNLGFSVEVKGTATGNHFELFVPQWNRERPVFVGDLVNGELHGMEGRRSVVAKPAGPGDDIPAVAYIEPPPLHPVPSNGLARTPPMGWNSWNLFAGRIDDQTVRTMADAMVSSGMRDAGYIYLNIDDTWEGVRDAQGNLQSNHKFPDMKALADYVHSRGLKLGIYSGPGPRTCAGYPASYGHEAQDAQTFAAWGVDYLKYDNCSAAPGSDMQTDYTNMKNALVKSGRPIVFSQCAWWFYNWEPTTGNLWRTTTDIKDTWASMLANFDQSQAFSGSAKPGAWNDPDMLEVGNGGMTDVEYRTHMGLWAIAAAPLIAGNDIANMSAATKAILVAPEILAVDQDSLGKQGTVASDANNLEILSKPLVGGNVRAVALFNRGTTTADIPVTWSQLGLPAGSYAVRDLWAQKDLGKFSTGYTAMAVASHATVMISVSPPSTAIATISNPESSSLETRVANHSLQVSFHPSPEVASAVLELCDLHGRLAGRIAMANGSNGAPVNMSVEGIHGGVYYLLARGNGTILARKTVILPE